MIVMNVYEYLEGGHHYDESINTYRVTVKINHKFTVNVDARSYDDAESCVVTELEQGKFDYILGEMAEVDEIELL